MRSLPKSECGSAVLRSQIFAQRARGCYAETLPERLGPNDARRRLGQGGRTSASVQGPITLGSDKLEH